MDKNLTADRLRELLLYDPDTGVFRWRLVTSNRVCVGAPAGSKQSCGYIQIRIDRRAYVAHRLAWLFVHGVWPKEQIDHRNGIRDDNRFVNLREATLAENNQNRGVSPRNTSGHTGVYFNKKTGKWHAEIMTNRRKKHLGCFNDIEDAISARKAAKAANHKFNPEDRGVS